jgi:orotate phosphoribosyltransferase
MVSLNRMEVGGGGTKAAIDEVSDRYGFPTAAIVDMAEVTDALHNHEVDGRVIIDDTVKLALDRYYARYGVK